MKYTMRVLARAKHGAQLEDLGISFVTPKPKITRQPPNRSRVLAFDYARPQHRGRARFMCC
jgi:hypothetical protein